MSTWEGVQVCALASAPSSELRTPTQSVSSNFRERAPKYQDVQNSGISVKMGPLLVPSLASLLLSVFSLNSPTCTGVGAEEVQLKRASLN